MDLSFCFPGLPVRPSEEKETNLEAVAGCQKELARLKQEQDKYYGLCAGLYDDLRQNVVTKEEFERLHKEFQSKAQELEKAHLIGFLIPDSAPHHLFAAVPAKQKSHEWT